MYQMPEIKKAFAEGKQQVIDYGKKLDDKYGNLRLEKFVVTALGFERVCFKKINPPQLTL